MSDYGIKGSNILRKHCTAYYIDPDYLVLHKDDHGFIIQAELIDPLIFKIRYFTKKAAFEIYEHEILPEVPLEDIGTVQPDVIDPNDFKRKFTGVNKKIHDLFTDIKEDISKLSIESKKGQIHYNTLANISSKFIRFRPVLQYLSRIMAVLEAKNNLLKGYISKNTENKLYLFKTVYNIILGLFFEQLRKDVLIYLVKSYLETNKTDVLDKFLNNLKSLILEGINRYDDILNPNNNDAINTLIWEYIKPSIINIIQTQIIPLLDSTKPDRVSNSVVSAVSDLSNSSKYIRLIPGNLMPDDINNIIEQIIVKHIKSVQDIDNKKDIIKQEIENYYKDTFYFINENNKDMFNDWYNNVLKPNLTEALDVSILMDYPYLQEDVLSIFDAQVTISTPIKQELNKFFETQSKKIFNFKQKNTPITEKTEERENKILESTRDEMNKIYEEFESSGFISDITISTMLNNLFESYYGPNYLKKVSKDEIDLFVKIIKDNAENTVAWMHKLLSGFPTLETIYAMATYLWVNFLDKIYLSIERIEPPEVRERIKEMISIIKWAMKKIGNIINVAKDRYVYLGTNGDKVLLANYDELLNTGESELITSDESFDFEETNDQIMETLVKCPVSGMIVRQAMLCTSCPYGLNATNCSTCLRNTLEKEAQLKSKTPKVIITKNANTDELLDSISFKPEKKQIKTTNASILVYDYVMHRKTGELGVVVEKKVDGSLKVIWANTCKETPAWEQEVIKVDEESL